MNDENILVKTSFSLLWSMCVAPDNNTFHLQNQLYDARYLRTPSGLDWYVISLSSLRLLEHTQDFTHRILDQDFHKAFYCPSYLQNSE